MMKKERLRVLQITLGTGMLGGVSRFLINYYTAMDHTKVIFDFLFCHKNSFGGENGNTVLQDSNVYCLDCLDSNHNTAIDYLELVKRLKEFFRNHHYDIIHIHSGSIPLQSSCIYALRKTKYRGIIISHSHSVGGSIKSKHKYETLQNIVKSYINQNATYCFACSSEAAVALFGTNIIQSPKYKVIHNAIDCERFKYNLDERRRIRESLSTSEKTFVMGHVGRFDKVKNQIYLVSIFFELHKLVPNSVLWIIGDGKERNKIEEKIRKEKLEEFVFLFGERSDVASIIQGMDCFVLPSLYEGLSIVAIEAQAAGLPTYLSDSLSREHSITDLVEYISTDESPKFWAERIFDELKKQPRYNRIDEIIRAGYYVKTEADMLQRFYIDKGINNENKE